MYNDADAGDRFIVECDISSPWRNHLSCLMLFLYADWHREADKLTDIKESVFRLLILLPLFIIMSILLSTLIEFGTIWNVKYWIPMTYLTSEPVIATISTMFVAALLNVFIVPKPELVQVLDQ